MANPHPQYPHPGHPHPPHAHPAHVHPGHQPHPGPSTYFPHSPPPPFPYGPNPAFYTYPPPMNGQHSMHPPPASPRMNGTPRGAYHPHRAGAPGYQHFQHIPPQHFVPSHPATPTSASPANPFPHPQKFSQHLPPPSQVPYPTPYHPPYPQPSLQAQAMSPLPKQLSMPPPLAPQPPMHEPTSQPRPLHVHAYQNTLLSQPLAPSTPQPQIPPSLPSPEVAPPSLSPVADESPIPPPSPHPEPVEEPPRSPTPPSPQTVFAQVPSQPPSERASSPQIPASPTPIQSDIVSGWVIWTRKGHPANAPGIIISPRANPPPDIIQKALQLPSPPPSPKQPAKQIVFTAMVEPESELEPVHDGTLEQQEHSPEPADLPSSSATESTPACSTAPDTPMPGSPISTNTSVSLAPVASPVVEKPVAPTLPFVNKAESIVSEPSASEAAPTQEQPISSEPIASASTGSATPSVISSAPTPTPSGVLSVAPAPTPVSAPEPSSSAAAPAPPKPAPLKKSWASLLQSSDKPSSSKSRLPVSSVVGFSIPASAMSQSTSGSSAKAPARPEVVNLLQNGPIGPIPPPKIRPRGLVNTGNMCFANAVLQVLVYCPQFNRLFMELGKYISGPVVGSQKEGTKATPLVDATMQFLKEFMPPTTTSGGGDSKAKGKEKEEDDFYEPESFIPTFVYDVMKEKKRFANMVGGHQEDAEEFLGFFLDTLEEELLSIANSYNPENPKTNGPVEEREEPEAPQDDGWFEVGKRNRMAVTRTIKSSKSPITQIFGGKFRSTLRAPHQLDSVTIEDWRALRLDIQRDQIHNVKEALQLISHPQSVQISSPTRPGVVIDASQQTLIESLPQILVLHMKRFHYDTNVKDVVKIGKQVAFGPDLEISAELISPAARKPSQPVKYQLFGVLYHHGLSASGGHYTLDVLHPNRDMNDRPRPAWIRIDDELVSDIRADDVFGAGSDRDDRCAYLLFYRRFGAGISGKAWAQHVAAGVAHAK